MAVTWTADDELILVETRTARDSGVLSVRHGETSTQFRSLSEMDKIIAKMERRKANAADGTTRQRLYYPWQSSKAL